MEWLPIGIITPKSITPKTVSPVRIAPNAPIIKSYTIIEAPSIIEAHIPIISKHKWIIVQINMYYNIVVFVAPRLACIII
jgi:hypothetical protein